MSGTLISGRWDATPRTTTQIEKFELLHHHYSFDLATDSNINIKLLNLMPEVGDLFSSPTVTSYLYAINIFDNEGTHLYKGITTEQWTWGSTFSQQITGFLPAGNDYDLDLAGGVMHTDSPVLSYQLELVANAVPEPATYAMFFAGLGLLAWRLRLPEG